MPEKIPVLLITGFLASGKTTVLNRLLADGVKSAVIINEFGSTPVDQVLLDQQHIPMTVLAGGCLCCQIRGALTPTLKNLWMAWKNAETKPFQRVLIESSGVASPEPILDTLLREAWLSKRYQLQCVIATIAIPSAMEQVQRYAEARSQIVWADRLLLTHSDLAEVGQTAAAIHYLQSIAPATSCEVVDWEALSSFSLFGEVGSGFRRLPEGQPGMEHGFRSLSVYIEEPPIWPKLQAILEDLLQRYTPGLVRIKGVVYLPDHDQPLAIHAAAGHLYTPTYLPSRPGDDGRSLLVFITDTHIEVFAQTLMSAFHSHGHSIRLH